MPLSAAGVAQRPALLAITGGRHVAKLTAGIAPGTRSTAARVLGAVSADVASLSAVVARLATTTTATAISTTVVAVAALWT